MTEYTIPITFDPGHLHSYTDEFLSTLWHAGQANPAPLGDHQAADIAAKLGNEIIRRWLRTVAAPMYHHQPHHNYWWALTRIATYQPPDGVQHGDPDWHNGRWVPKPADDQTPASSGRPGVTP
jgi:hypothetical protein